MQKGFRRMKPIDSIVQTEKTDGILMSIVVPTFQEAENIRPLINKFINFLYCLRSEAYTYSGY